jgi:hypothetical protein
MGVTTELGEIQLCHSEWNATTPRFAPLPMSSDGLARPRLDMTSAIILAIRVIVGRAGLSDFLASEPTVPTVGAIVA